MANNITDLGLEERKFALSISIYNKYYNVVSIKLNYENSNKQDTAYKIKDFIDKRIDYSNKEVFVDIENNIIVINGWNDSPEVNFEEIFTRLIYDIKTEFNISVFITIGKTIEQSKNLSKSYESAIKLQEYILIRGYGNIISFNDLKRTNDEIQDVHINFDDFEKVLLAKDVEKVNKYITKTFNDIYELKTLTPEKLKDISIKMMLTIKEAAKDLNIEGRYNDDFLRVLILEICNKKSKEELVKMLQRESEELIDKINNNNGKFSPVIKQVLCYVNDHYNEELSLKTLANKYNINTSYLGQIFSKEVGCSFSDYLNRIKNEKAKELLLNTNMKINDIAKIVGYIDTSYFYRKFKKYFGVCPSTLRNSKNY
ncbi:helix-turn-helix transcriptional regulator [Clostridium fallax]|uniref:Two component transcriptional regulator, AraC family n=1 Tax=Clostridium fallax TaxID=1533 RepID=A0A1M4VTW9_9CLOT|nr:helix-turn-helix domain-containing protein [Clostridium fallax]SHE72474.1 two component transcriptional regulator, AraC family [Clostridium fallax]SQB07694.1 AraC family transcriptional regulator [Clostridium fallax]